MPRLHSLEPCSKCPFLRTSAPGWLGASTPKGFMQSVFMQECHMPCHGEIDYEKSDWREKQLPEAPLCAGSLIMMRNACKMPRDDYLAKAVGAVCSSEDVFKTPVEFIKHHTERPGL